MTDSRPFLSVRDLKVHFPTSDGLVKAVDGLSFDLERGKTLGIVGESGSGKSVSSSAILGLHRKTSAKVTGEILLDGTDLLSVTEEEMRKRRGREVAMIFQDPLSAMHPYYTVGNQIIEAYRVHNDVSKKAARRRAIEMLDRVGIPQPDRRVDSYPHQFSGGMRQRAMIAMGLINDPGLLIADEPTTALDVTVQAQILDLLQDLQREFHSAVMIITHDLGVVAEMADDVLVMYAGRAVEYGACKEILTHPEMPYTWGLLSSVPDVKGDTDEAPDPHPRQPAEPAQPAIGLPLPPTVPAQGQGARRPVPDRAARAPAGPARSRAHQALPPARPRRDLPDRGAAGNRPRAGRGPLMTDVACPPSRRGHHAGRRSTPRPTPARRSSRRGPEDVLPGQVGRPDPTHRRTRPGRRRRLLRSPGRRSARPRR